MNMQDHWERQRARRGRFTLTLSKKSVIYSGVAWALWECGHRTDQIANMMGISEAAVANALHHQREARRK
jgi:DNA-binding transcriptional regulator LsrR (DeoR family)